MLEIKAFTFGPFETNTYVVSNEQQILLVDPACYTPYEQQILYNYLQPLTRSSLHPLTIVATHGHLDHLWGAKWATEQWNTPVLIHEADIPMVQAMQQQYNMFGIRAKAEEFPIESLTGEAGLTVKRSYSEAVLQQSGLRIIHTPGHTPGSVCLYWSVENILISGDTLFHMGYGRTDLPGGDMGQLITSLEHLFTLPASTLVYPGHGDFTTIGAEKR